NPDYQWKRLFLDDTRACPQGFDLSRNATDCVEKLRSNEYDEIWLDYDLGDGLDGDHVAHEICALYRDGSIPRLKKVVVHSSNKKGSAHMMEDLKRMTGLEVVRNQLAK
ncbi:MAG: hypothetical protein A2350_17985, partial [Candidatus Raymondbacteria bacterium RifOxyB12_full_50_8]